MQSQSAPRTLAALLPLCGSIRSSCARQNLSTSNTKHHKTHQRVFDSRVKVMHRDQSARASLAHGFDKTEYLRDAVAANLVDRLPDITLPLHDALDIGCGSGSILRSITEYAKATGGQIPAGIQRLTIVDESSAFVDVAKTQPCPDGMTIVGSHVCALDKVCQNFQRKESVDLVMSSLSLHWVNDLKAALRGVHDVLRPDGAFIGAVFGDETLFELRTSLAIAEQEREGGISPHISPMLPSSDACALLQGAKFTMPTVDTMKVQVDFDDMFAVMESLSLMGESNAALGRRNHVSRHTMLAAATIYQELFGNGDGTVPATFEIICMIGWKKSSGQKAPLNPQVANVSMMDLGKGYSSFVTKHDDSANANNAKPTQGGDNRGGCNAQDPPSDAGKK